MSICSECIQLKAKLATLQNKYLELLEEHRGLLTVAGQLLKTQREKERQEQIDITNKALESLGNDLISLPPLKDNSDG